MNKYLRPLALGLVLAVSLLGCGSGSGDYGDTPGAGSVVVVPDSSGALSAPTDTSISSLSLKISPEYDSTTNSISLYMLIQDQDGNIFDQVNKYNFTVWEQMNGSRAVDIASDDVSIDLVTGVTDHTVSLGLDNSGSMSSEDFLTGKTSMEIAKEAATLYVDLMGPTDKTSIVKFSTVASIMTPVTRNKTVLKNAIATLEPDASTNIGDAVKKCVDVLGAYPGKTAAVVMTDGGDTEGFIDEGIAAAKSVGMPVFTIGLGFGVSEDELKKIAEQTGGQYFPADTTDLGDVFSITLPAEIDKLPPRSAKRLKVPLLFPPPGQFEESVVQFSVTLTFTNARKTHRVTASGSCTIAE